MITRPLVAKFCSSTWEFKRSWVQSLVREPQNWTWWWWSSVEQSKVTELGSPSPHNVDIHTEWLNVSWPNEQQWPLCERTSDFCMRCRRMWRYWGEPLGSLNKTCPCLNSLLGLLRLEFTIEIHLFSVFCPWPWILILFHWRLSLRRRDVMNSKLERHQWRKE